MRLRLELCVLAFLLLFPARALANPFVINEVVTDPQQDWGDNAGVPFDPTPGGGAVSVTDQYIELKNVTSGSASLNGWTLRMADATPADDCFTFDTVAPCTEAQVYRVYNAAGVELTGTLQDLLSQVPPGGYVVIGNPSGQLSNAVTVALLDPGDVVIDTIDISGNAASLLDESQSRFSDGLDTGVPEDFAPLAASLGGSNGTLCDVAVGELVINEAVADPLQDWDHDGGPGAFNGTDGGGVADNDDDEYIELKNKTAAELDVRGCIVAMTDTSATSIVLQALDAAAAPYVRVFDSTGVLTGTAPSLATVPAGGYVVIGNPPGSLNNAIVLGLRGTAQLDQIDFGGDGPNLNATTLDDQAGARVPDGADTDVSATDVRLQRATPGATNELDECTLMLDNCNALATCSDTPPGFDCTCIAGYTGDGVTCSDIDECQTGADDCAANASCLNNDGSFGCECLLGYEGDGVTCDDIDECATGADDCGEDASCSNEEGTFSCACNVGYDGDGVICSDLDECVAETDDCDEYADCQNEDGGFSCACLPGYSGNGRECTRDEPEGTDEVEQNGVDTDSGGCGCTTVGAPSVRGWALAALAATALLRRRRGGAARRASGCRPSGGA
jgi:hypothetical protein